MAEHPVAEDETPSAEDAAAVRARAVGGGSEVAVVCPRSAWDRVPVSVIAQLDVLKVVGHAGTPRREGDGIDFGRGLIDHRMHHDTCAAVWVGDRGLREGIDVILECQ